MPIALHYRLRQRTAYRTRITLPCLWREPLRCEHVRTSLLSLDGVADIQVRSGSGSVIVLHPQGPIDLDDLLARIALAVQGVPAPSSKALSRRHSCDCLVNQASPGESRGHVSGPVLFLSGLYVLYLYAKRLFLALTPTITAPTRLLTLPALVALAISLPIQRQAIDNLRQSGKPDMGLISTGLLYFSLLTGNTLAALTVFWLFNLSSWLEDRIRIRTRQAVREMLSDTCQRAWLLRDGIEVEVDAADLQPGEVIVLRRGNVVVADGTVLAGSAFVDEAALTGEDAPVARCVDDPVLAGTVVVEGFLQVRVERAGEATRLSAIIRLIEEAEHDPGDLQRASRRFSRAMVPVSLGLATAAFLFTGNLMQAMAVLIITCPCALRLSTSVAVSGAMSSAARDGILIKGGRYVEIAGQIDVLAVDKTGTLTDRSSEVSGIRVLDHRFRRETVLRLAASAQQAWSHPLSRALTLSAKSLDVPLLPVEEPELVIGRGVRGRIDGQVVLVGQAAFLREQGVKVDETLDTPPANGSTALLVACSGRLIGVIDLRHRWRPGIKTALERLKGLGVRHLVLLTGDNGVGAIPDWNSGFDQVLCNQSPEAKAAWIVAWKKEHPKDMIAMVGDGINDTPAFAAADLSLAIGEGGAEVTVEYADIVLRYGGLEQAAEALTLGRRTLDTIKECYALAIGLNAILLGLTTLGLLSPVAGALLHNLTTVLTVTNASTLAYKTKAAGKGEGRLKPRREIGKATDRLESLKDRFEKS